MASVIVGLFETPQDAAAAVHTLESKGLDSKRISLLAGESFKKDAFGINTHSKLPEGVAIGATSGAAIGALIAGLTAVGAIATGGASLLVSGPLVAALAGAGAGAASGGLLGGLVGVAIPEHEVKYYEDAIAKGSVLVGVDAKGGTERDLVKDTFKALNAKKISNA